MEDTREQLNECNGEPGISSSEEEEEEEEEETGEYAGYQRLDLAGADVVIDGEECEGDSKEEEEGYMMRTQDEDCSEREQKLATAVQDEIGRGREEETPCPLPTPMEDGE